MVAGRLAGGFTKSHLRRAAAQPAADAIQRGLLRRRNRAADLEPEGVCGRVEHWQLAKLDQSSTAHAGGE